MTVEDNALETGFGSAVLEYLNANDIRSDVLRLGIPDHRAGPPRQLYEDLGLSSGGIADSVEKWLKENQKQKPKIKRFSESEFLIFDI